MGFFDFVNSAKTSMFDAVSRFRNEDFLKAVIAGCVLVAGSDGSIDASEKQKMLGFITGNESLKAFDINDIQKHFGHYVSRLEQDYTIGKAEALQALSRIKSSAEQAELVVHVCIAIAKSDGHLSGSERNAINEVINTLGLNPNQFNF